MQSIRSGRKMKIRCPLHINKQKARNSCSTHALNNLTAMNNFSYCVCDWNNFSPGYILKVNLKELDGADKFIHGHTDKCKPTWKTGRREGQAICWEACTGCPRLIKSLLGGLSHPLSIRQKHVWWRLNSKSSVQCCTHMENWIWTFA